MRRRTLFFLIALGLFSTAASALPTAPITSGNGMLQFSNFQFFSPFNTVNQSDVTVAPLTDGLRFSGNVSTSTDVKSFYVLYDINMTPAAAGQGISRASMQLESSVDSDTFGLVLATKRLIGDKNDPRNFFGKSDANAKGTRALSRGTDAFNDSTSNFGLGGFDRKTVAFLKTADWATGSDIKFRPPLGLGGDGAIRMVEAGFANQTHLRVIEHVVVAADSGTATWTATTEHFITKVAVVPEPGTASLVLLGFTVVAMGRRRVH
ncbi:MAG TPA: PEP-CTERM sorting domain-containing protein [Myxococcota bacterium]|nr:PEP-CTERM sorting domain-containing protein [Myxococcota bacterium]